MATRPHRQRAFPAATALTLLLAAYVLAFAQRQLPATLSPVLVARSGIGDAALGALHGASFALSYGLFAVGGGWLVDRAPRVVILASGLAIASLATAAGAFATDFGSLVASRSIVGLGQAALVPAAYSLIGDLVPPRQSGRGIAVFACGPFVGAGLMLLVGGAALPALGWSATFLVVGGGGVAIAALLARLPEPVRRLGVIRDRGTIDDHFRTHWRAILAVLVTMLCNAAAGQTLLGWTMPWLMRGHHLTAAAASALFGAAVLVGGIAGTLAAGAASDALLRRDVPRLMALAVTAAAGAMIAAAVFMSDDPAVAEALLLPMVALVAAAHATGPTALQDITPAALRGRQHGVAVLLVNLFGFAFAPWLVGLASDAGMMLGGILALTVPTILAVSALAALLGARVHARSAATVAQATTPGRPSSIA